jgi:hypothetical protein
VKTDLPIRGLENALDGVGIRELVAPFQPKHRRVRATDQPSHAGKAEFFACSPIFELHNVYVRKTHIVVNAAFAGGEHR